VTVFSAEQLTKPGHFVAHDAHALIYTHAGAGEDLVTAGRDGDVNRQARRALRSVSLQLPPG
jgi:hypothetical protein